MNSVQFSEIITTLGNQRNISDMQLQENICSLRLAEMSVNIYNEEAQEEVYLCSSLGRAPAEPEKRLRIYTSLMESNCFYGRTGGGIFGVGSEGDISFTLKFPADALDADILSDLVSLHFEIINEQMQQLHEISQQTKTDPHTLPSGSVRI